MTYSINWPITLRSAVPLRSGNYIFPYVWITPANQQTRYQHVNMLKLFLYSLHRLKDR